MMERERQTPQQERPPLSDDEVEEEEQQLIGRAKTYNDLPTGGDHQVETKILVGKEKTTTTTEVGAGATEMKQEAGKLQ
jgi:hypothetical protein